MRALRHAAPTEALVRALRLVVLCAALIVASLAIIVLLDVPWQIWNHLKKLRMSKEDVRQEHKESEGDPHIKARIRQQQRAMARRRMMSEVPRADVVVTNPTHYAVALRYADGQPRSEEHTSELQSLMRISYAVFCVKQTDPHHSQWTARLR